MVDEDERVSLGDMAHVKRVRRPSAREVMCRLLARMASQRRSVAGTELASHESCSVPQEEEEEEEEEGLFKADAVGLPPRWRLVGARRRSPSRRAFYKRCAYAQAPGKHPLPFPVSSSLYTAPDPVRHPASPTSFFACCAPSARDLPAMVFAL